MGSTQTSPFPLNFQQSDAHSQSNHEQKTPSLSATEGMHGIRVVQSCHLLVCLFIYRHFTVKLVISEYDR